MNMLYDSDTFSVLHVLANEGHAINAAGLPAQADGQTEPAAPQMPRLGFEIVDKRSGKELYLDGSWAEFFQIKINDWQRNTPTQEEVESLLDGYATLAQTPLVVH
jgi:hypothetical protein